MLRHSVKYSMLDPSQGMFSVPSCTVRVQRDPHGHCRDTDTVPGRAPRSSSYLQPPANLGPLCCHQGRDCQLPLQHRPCQVEPPKCQDQALHYLGGCSPAARAPQRCLRTPLAATTPTHEGEDSPDTLGSSPQEGTSCVPHAPCSPHSPASHQPHSTTTRLMLGLATQPVSRVLLHAAETEILLKSEAPLVISPEEKDEKNKRVTIDSSVSEPAERMGT